MSDSARISPTAHLTGFVWARAGLSHPELVTTEGRVLYESLRPMMGLSGWLGGAQLEPYLLSRHRAIDVLLERSIEAGTIGQVLEVACGLSPRGWRFHRRYGDRITYVEADLPGMAARKRAALERMGSLGPDHRVAVIDALSDESVADLLGTLDPERGLAIVTEGLTGYLTPEQLEGLWARCARALGRFPAGRYISDLHVGERQALQVRAFRLLLSAFVRGTVHLHYGTREQARHALQAAGFATVRVGPAGSLAPVAPGRGADLVSIVEASTA